MPREPGRLGPKRKVPETRGTASQRGYGYAWRKYSAQRLKLFPLCYYCQLIGKVTAATMTDHGTPHKGDLKLLWESENHFSSCATHNSAKGDMTREEYESKLMRDKHA